MEYILNGTIVGAGNSLQINGTGVTGYDLDDGFAFNIPVGGSGGMEIGTPVISGDVNSILFVNIAGNLSQESSFTYDSVNDVFRIGTFNFANIYCDVANQIVVLNAGDGGTNTGQVTCNTTGVQIYAAGTGECYLNDRTHLISNQAGVPTITVTTQNGITAAAISNHSSDVAGVITTTGTNNAGGNSVLHVAFMKAFPANNIPRVVITPLNAAAAKASDTTLITPLVNNVDITGFDIVMTSDAGALATPSWSYHVIGAHN